MSLLIRGATTLLVSLVTTMIASAAPGDLDTTFNNPDGVVISGNGGFERANAMAVQSDGKIVVVGDQSFSGDFVVMRYTAGGVLDTTFDGDGIVTTHFPGSIGADQALAVAIQSDGKIVVAGYTDVSGNGDVGVARYLPNGTLDDSFGGDGTVTADFGNEYEEAKGIVVQTDGKIVVVGNSQDPMDFSTADFIVARFTTAGVLDNSFSGDGKVKTDFSTGGDFATCVALQPDGKIVVGGDASVAGSGKFAVARYTTAGALDTTFSSDGKAVGPFGFGTGIAVHDTKIVLGGYTFGEMDQDFAVVRFTSAGVLDPTFSGDGMVTLHLGAEDRANALVVEPGGKIILAGSSGAEDPMDLRDFAVARFTTNGILDTGFGNGGFVTTDVRSTNVDDAATGIQLDADGNLVVAGYSDDGSPAPMGVDYSYDFVVARYEGGEPPPAPEIAVFAGIGTSPEEELDSGDSIPLPSANVGLNSALGTATILNKGDSELTGISVAMAGPSDFTIVQQPAGSLLPGQSTTFTIRFSPTAGGLSTGTVEIQSNDANESPFELVVRSIVPSASSDSFVGRVNLGSSPTVDVASSNAGATTEAGEPVPGAYSGASVWYEWTAPATGWVTVSTTDSEIDTVLGLFTGTAVNSLAQLGFNDESYDYDLDGESNASRLTFYASMGTTYVVGVFGYADGLPATAEKGKFELHIAPASPKIRLTEAVSGTADVTAGTATATVRATIELDPSLTSFFGSANVLKPGESWGMGISFASFDESDLDSGTLEDGEYDIEFPLPQYLSPGSRTFTVDLSADGKNTRWTAQGADLTEDSYLIPNAPASVIVTNSGTSDTVAPSIVSVTGFPSNVDVSFGDQTFNVDITVNDALAGANGGFVEGVTNNGRNYYRFADFSSAEELPPGGGATVTYRVPVTVYADTPPGTFFVGITVRDKTLNEQLYSDDPAQLSESLRIPPSPAQLKFTITNTSGTAPEIVVEQPGDRFLVDNSGTVSFGAIERGESRTRTFIIKNFGDKALTGIAVTKAGANGADFTVDDPYYNVLPPGWWTEFTVRFSPGGAGSRSAIIKVASNDGDENPFEINVTGSTPPGPEIAVEQPTNTGLAAGLSSVGFGAVATNASATKSFTIRNSGNVPLLYDAMVMGADAGSFSFTTTPTGSVAAGAMATLTVKFAPTSASAKTAVLQIANNDGNEGLFDVELTGTGTASAGTFVFSAPYYQVGEAAGPVPVVVNRIGGNTGAVKVKVTSTNGTASAGSDFTAVNQVLTFPAGNSDPQTINIPIQDNVTTAPETNEAFTVTLSDDTTDAVVAVLGAPSTATVRIMDSAADNANPTVAITTPALNAVVSETQSGYITVTGTATDDKGVSEVQVSINGGGPVTATLTSASKNGTPATYSALVSPDPGPNIITVKSFDTTTGTPKQSGEVQRSFTYAVMRPLTVWVNGGGSVTAAFFPTSQRQVGLSYNIVATPAAGQVFTGWQHNGSPATGITPAKAELPSLTFTMEEGLELTANFISSPFLAEAGTYNGLVKSSGLTSPSTSTEGFFTLKLETSGAFSGKLTLDGFILNVNGLFDNDGKARFGTGRTETIQVIRTGKPNVEVALTLEDLDNPPFGGAGADQVTGTVIQKYRSVTTGTSDIVADRAVAFNVYDGAIYAPGATTTLYNSLITPRDDADPSMPAIFNGAPEFFAQGVGYAAITLTKAGVVVFTGTLSDGTTPVTISSTISKDLQSPLFAQLYSKLGFISGRLALNVVAESDMSTGLDGMLWSRPYQDVQHYEYGWPEVITVDLKAARYFAPSTGQSALTTAGLDPAPNTSTANADVTFYDRNQDPYAPVKEVSISLSDMVTKLDSPVDPNFTLSITRTSGLISGSFLRPGDAVKSDFKGLIYQKGANPGGHGYYLTPTPKPLTYDGESGTVKLIPR